MAQAEEWFPTGDPYLDRADKPPVRPNRPIAHGDVFLDVPVALYRKHPPKRAGQHPTDAKETSVMLYGHPCSSRRGDRLEQVPNVVVVARAERLLGGTAWGPPYRGRYRFFPLRGLVGGEDYVADLGQVAVTRVEYLAGKRVACLSFEGFAAFQGRCVMAVSRMNPGREEHERRCFPLWAELELWERWTSARETEAGFSAWLDEPLGSRDQATRRAALMGAPEEVSQELDHELA